MIESDDEEGVAYNAPSIDINVKSWSGKIQNNNWTIGTQNNVW